MACMQAGSAAAGLGKFRRAVLRWYRTHRRDLPWRRTQDPYAILVSEVMLQQTQVDRVIPKYRAFLRRFPTVQVLARARLGDVLRVWSGLGYNGRARRLWECARLIVGQHGAHVPIEPQTLRALPGIGHYTAAAVAAFAYGQRTAAVDTNVKRVLARVLLGRSAVADKTAWRLADEALPRSRASMWNQALMELGALVCKSAPKCHECPAARYCAWVARAGRKRSKPRRMQSPFPGSRRFYRGRVLHALSCAASLSLPKLGLQVKEGFDQTDLPWLNDLLAELEGEGLVAVDRRRGRARLP